MKISLKEWVEIHQIVSKLKGLIEEADIAVFHLIHKYHDSGTPEYDLLRNLNDEIHFLREHCPQPYHYIPQSEWLGGNPSDPSSHVLKEPNIVPGYLKRRFTKEEMKEAGAVNHGPVHWTYDNIEKEVD